jgi:predicted Fe-S protein YdhL (DUF1289 family)|tara:strand:- start:166 stop:591 length:426 start_codon:yes stop_codon:yes gene_type:complete
MNTALHECISLANSPCVGVCSTSVAPFDETCIGCGRTVDQIRDWESFSDFEKKIINTTNWLKGYNIRQKKDKIIIVKNNISREKLKDIQGRLITIQALIEMVGKDLVDFFGTNPIIENTYKSLYQSRESVLEAKQTLPHLD